jgi:hypothetical protein
MDRDRNTDRATDRGREIDRDTIYLNHDTLVISPSSQL